MTRTELPRGRAPESLRERRMKREGATGAIAHPNRNSKVAPSATPGDTVGPAPPQRAAFWRHGPGSGAWERCPPRVL